MQRHTEDTPVRMGGDACVVLMRRFDHECDTTVLADKLIQSPAAPIETAAQAQFLLDEGCPEAQGYDYSRPVAADEITGLMRDNGLACGALGL